MNLYKKNNFCNNCGKIGHLFHQCKIPITSIGIIAFRKIKNNLEILIVNRKDTLAFIDFMRGKYNLEDNEYITELFKKMTKQEHELILKNEFNELWNYIWGDEMFNQYKSEEKLSKIKFEELKRGYYLNNKMIKLDNLIKSIDTKYEETEWGFPKGRRNYQEKDITCALREFEEETGYDKSNLIVLQNIFPIEEIFTGSNLKSYKHKYYLALMNNNDKPENNFQLNEISKIKWENINTIKNKIRDYNYEKKLLIDEIIKILKCYKVYI
jgi:8-oxo-dGTP pyrophosphatase MutT (NUDIX family)